MHDRFRKAHVSWDDGTLYTVTRNGVYRAQCHRPIELSSLQLAGDSSMAQID